jgi:DNA-binding transcriptional MerR regulator
MGEGEYTIDELSTVSKVPSRTIRFYQSRGALQAPTIRGRVAVYGAEHVERLKLIAQLQDRGLRIDAIRDLVASIDKGEVDLAEWLGVERQMQASWANDQPRMVTEEELYELAGVKRPGLLADLVRVKLVERRGDSLLLQSPALLAVAMKLEAAGIDLQTAVQASAILRKHIQRAVAEVVDLFVAHAKDGKIGAESAGDLFQALRPMGLEAVRVIFGREMETALRKLLESGKATSLPAKVKKKRS